MGDGAHLTCIIKCGSPQRAARFLQKIGSPLLAENKTGGPAMDQTPGAEDTQKTILVVDDDLGILRSVSGLLAKSNYKVLTASSGKEALQLSRNYEREIHLLLSDFQMPGMNGIDLATELTTDRPRLKVLMMSGFTGGMPIPNDGWHVLAKPLIP